jgi:transcriptional regulator with XRE-family HTH domain
MGVTRSGRRLSLVLMSQPNTALRSVRQGMRLSQDELARAIREAGRRNGEPNECSKRLIQRWESGLTTAPRGTYLRALEYVTGQPAENLGFASAAERYGLDRRQALGLAGATAAALAIPDPKIARGPLTGIWRSQYSYVSSGRGDQTFTDQHFVMVIQHGARVRVRSLPESAPSLLSMDLTVNGQVLTGTWTEDTNPAGYYQGSTYHGAIQLLIEPTNHRMSGRWVGFGRDFDVNDGPWLLELVSEDTDPAAIRRFSRRPDPLPT